ncbi:MAG: NUDIX domain-containing protein [Desulfobacterales bacterium]|nr:NUDIX domain-containing protein [Desulfobacterales bacterium]
MTTEGCDARRGGPAAIRFCPFCGNPLHDRFWEGALRRFCRRCRQPVYENPVPAACVVVPDSAGRILLVRRGVAPKMGLWCLPGGFMELGEAPEAAALRELREEAGLKGRIECLLGLRSTPSRLYHTILLAAYLVRTDGKTPVAGDDATAARWFDPADLPPIAFDSHREFIRRFVDLKYKNTG